MKNKPFIGGYINPKLLSKVRAIARKEKRSVNSVLEIFLSWGVFHHKQQKAAMGSNAQKAQSH
jgi:hypothetical protein